MPARPIPPPAPGKRALAPRSSLKIFYLPPCRQLLPRNFVLRA